MKQANDTVEGLNMAKAPSMWLTEMYTSPNGKTYKRYVLDQNGQRIPKDSSLTPEQIEQLMKEKAAEKTKKETSEEAAARKDRKIKNALAREHKHRHGHRLVPIYITRDMRELMEKAQTGKANPRCMEYDDKSSNYRVILANPEREWFLIHAQIKKNLDIVHKWFFYNPNNEAHIDFDHIAHIESKVGDKGLQWPEKSTAEPSPPPPAPKNRRPRKAA